MRLLFKKFLILILSLTVLFFIGFQIFRIYNSARQTLAEERARLLEQNRVAFEKRFLTPHLSDKISIRQNTGETRDFVKYKDSFYAATGGGLVEYDADGKLKKHFTVLDGLPESDLTALAVFGGALFIGTRTKNLVTFDGEKFANYIWTDRRAESVTAFLVRDGRLLIGTFGGGLLDFDGENFTEIKAGKERIAAINYLYETDGNLYVGTFNNGLLIYVNDVWTRFTTANGLPSNRVVGIALKDKNLYAATDFGLAVLNGNSFRSLVTLPSLSGLAVRRNQILLLKDSGEIFTFDNSLNAFSKPEKNLQNSRFASADEQLTLLSNRGIFVVGDRQIKPFRKPENETLTDNFVSALAFDKDGNFWVGSFRDGIDIYSPNGSKLKHIESETVREINYLRSNDGGISAATSAGIINFKSDFSAETLSKSEGLPSNSITHFSGDYVATAKGLAYRENGQFHVLSTVQNLPNNSIYTTLQVGEKTYAGTLGGLAQIENKRVVRSFKDSNSNLETNWVTALCYADERIFIGTYGGGIFELTPSGEIRSFQGEAGKFVVNPNALYSDGQRLYAGTLQGVKILNLQTQEWHSVRNILPSETVMSVIGDAQSIYFGTADGIAQVDKDYFEKGGNE
jgi:ligand-binding sensor domain-containing protein